MSNHNDVPVPVDGVADADAAPVHVHAPAPAPAPAPAALYGVGAVGADDYRAAAAAAVRVGIFDFLNNLRNRTIFCYTAWGFAGIVSTTTAPRLSVNSDHIMFYFFLLMDGVVLYVLSMAAADLPWMEGWAARLEGILAKMIPGLLG